MGRQRKAEHVVSAHADMLLRLSMTYLHSRSDAEDVCQDVLVRYMQRILPFASEEHERAWLIRTCINASKDVLRYQQRHMHVPLEEVEEQGADDPPSPLEAKERGASLREAVLRLPVAQREAIHLHYYEGYSIGKIARLTGRSADAVDMQLSRGRAALKVALGDDFHGSF